MALTDDLTILYDTIKVNQAQRDLVREALKISALSSKDILEKYKYLTGKDLGHRPSVLEKTKSESSPLGMSLSKSLKKDNVKNIANRERDFNYDTKHSLYRFYKEYNEFEKMSLNSKYNKMKKFTDLLPIFNNLKPKNPKTHLKKEQIMKNVDDLYENYYNDYKNDFDKDDGLDEGKKKKLTTNSLNCWIKQTKS